MGWHCIPIKSVVLQVYCAGINLETAVGRARVGCDAVGWQGATLLRARAREEKQRGKPAAAQLSRVCSAFTQEVNDVV
jgi:hypothetical protein